MGQTYVIRLETEEQELKQRQSAQMLECALKRAARTHNAWNADASQ